MEGDHPLCKGLAEALRAQQFEIMDELYLSAALHRHEPCAETDLPLSHAWLGYVLDALAEFLVIPEQRGLHDCVERWLPTDLDQFTLLQRLDAFSEVVNRRLMYSLHSASGTAAEAAEASQRLQRALRSLTHECLLQQRVNEQGLSRLLSRHIVQYARGVGHRLRQPLQTLELSTSILRRHAEDPPGELTHCAELIESSLARMSLALHALQTLVAYEGTRASSDARSHLKAVADAVIDSLRDLAEAYNVQLVCEDLPAVECDQLPVRLVLLALVSNGIRYSDPDKSERRVEIGAEVRPAGRAGGHIEIQVRDNGVGIPEEVREAILGNSSLSGAASSGEDGMGLTLCRDLLMHYGGDLTLNSRLGAGSTFLVRLPDNAPSREAVDRAIPPLSAQDHRGRQPPGQP